MNDYEPGAGWREVIGAHSIPAPCITFSDGETVRRWVREPPVPPLPTEQYTVIRVTWAKGAREGVEDMLVNYLGGWCDLEGTIYTQGATAASITGFEVLAEPRAVTAKADIARELGAES